MEGGNTVNSRERLKELLNELFRIESSDLDFGIYRIINIRRKTPQIILFIKI